LIARNRSPCFEAIYHKAGFQGRQHTDNMTLKHAFHTLSTVFFLFDDDFSSLYNFAIFTGEVNKFALCGK